MKTFENFNEIINIDSLFEGVMSPEASADHRKKAAAPTGEAALAREMQVYHRKSGATKQDNQIERDGVRGEIELQNPKGGTVTAKALFWYDREKMMITTMIGSLKRITFKGRKDKHGLYTKFTVSNKSQLRASDSAYKYLSS